MTVTTQQSRLLVWLVCLLAASFTLTGLLTNALPMLAGTVVLTILGVMLALKTKQRSTIVLVLGTIIFFCTGMVGLFMLTDTVMDGKYGPSNSAMAVGTLIHASLLAALTIWILRRFRSSETATATAPVVSPAVSTPPPATAPEEHPLDGFLTEERREWLAHTYALPLSRRYAAAAAATRALEQGKDWEMAKQAAGAAAKAWELKPGVSVQVITNEALKAGAWREIRFESASQMLAAEAAVLRALEFGKDMATATEAARTAAKSWAPPPPTPSPTPASPETTAARTGAALQGVVYGYMRRNVPFPMTGRRRVTYIDRSVWTFTVQRKGIGENGRPLSPIQVQMEGYRIDGQLEDGDMVRFDTVPTASEVNTLSRIQNLSKGVELLAHPIQESPQYKEFQSNKILVFILIVLLGGGILAGIFSEFKKQSAAIQQRFPH